MPRLDFEPAELAPWELVRAKERARHALRRGLLIFAIAAGSGTVAGVLCAFATSTPECRACGSSVASR